MRSMTGCGSGKVQRDGWEVTVDLKTVNHRFLDIGMRLPRNLAFLEQTVRDCLGKKIRRGHADVFLTVKRTDASDAEVTCDTDLAARYLHAAEEIIRATGVRDDMAVSQLMKMPISRNRTTTKMTGILYSANRKARAPSAMAAAISCMRALPASAEVTRLIIT